MEYFDTHIHLDDEKFNEDRAEVIQKMQNAGVTRCINMGCNIETSKKAIELSKNMTSYIQQLEFTQKNFHKQRKNCGKV